MSDSIVVRLKPGLSRDDADNASTLFRTWPEKKRSAFRDVFIQNYESIRSSREALSGPGVTVTVIGPSGFEGTAAIAAMGDAINALSIGRHSHANLFLSGEMRMSLRQGAVILYPLGPLLFIGSLFLVSFGTAHIISRWMRRRTLDRRRQLDEEHERERRALAAREASLKTSEEPVRRRRRRRIRRGSSTGDV